jgi:hypothetical protein
VYLRFAWRVQGIVSSTFVAPTDKIAEIRMSRPKNLDYLYTSSFGPMGWISKTPLLAHRTVD